MSFQKFNIVTELKKVAAGKPTKADLRVLAGLAADALKQYYAGLK